MSAKPVFSKSDLVKLTLPEGEVHGVVQDMLPHPDSYHVTVALVDKKYLQGVHVQFVEGRGWVGIIPVFEKGNLMIPTKLTRVKITAKLKPKFLSGDLAPIMLEAKSLGLVREDGKLSALGLRYLSVLIKEYVGEKEVSFTPIAGWNHTGNVWHPEGTKIKPCPYCKKGASLRTCADCGRTGYIVSRVA